MTASINQVVKYRSDQGVFTAMVVKNGSKFIHLLPMVAFGETGLKVVKEPASTPLLPVLYKGRPYPLNRAMTKFRAAYRKFGGTKAVKQALYH